MMMQVQREEIMTDFQFKKILQMVDQILDKSDSLDDAKKSIKILVGKEDEKKDDKKG